MARNISVTLTQGNVEVDIKDNQHVVCRGSGHQTIRWTLKPAAQQHLAFEGLGTSTAGFAWISTPPTGVFGEPEMLASGAIRIAMTEPPDTPDCWIYMLRVRDLDTREVFSTTVSATSVADPHPNDPCTQPTTVATTAMRVSDNPIIINR